MWHFPFASETTACWWEDLFHLLEAHKNWTQSTWDSGGCHFLKGISSQKFEELITKSLMFVYNVCINRFYSTIISLILANFSQPRQPAFAVGLRQGGRRHFGEMAAERLRLRPGLPQRLQGGGEGSSGTWGIFTHRPGRGLAGWCCWLVFLGVYLGWGEGENRSVFFFDGK